MRSPDVDQRETFNPALRWDGSKYLLAVFFSVNVTSDWLIFVALSWFIFYSSHNRQRKMFESDESTPTGWSKKPHKVNDTIILQPYVIESCGFQQNVPKEIYYVTKVNIWIQLLNILCYCRWKLNCAKSITLDTAVHKKHVSFIFWIAPWNIGRF